MPVHSPKQMSEISEIKIDAIGVGARLIGGLWMVPVYQRSYKWEDKQVNELFSDIENAIAERHPEYFLGSIVVAHSNPRPHIVDGQQRLATISVFFAAVRDFFSEKGDQESASIIEQQYLFHKELE